MILLVVPLNHAHKSVTVGFFLLYLLEISTVHSNEIFTEHIHTGRSKQRTHHAYVEVGGSVLQKAALATCLHIIFSRNIHRYVTACVLYYLLYGQIRSLLHAFACLSFCYSVHSVKTSVPEILYSTVYYRLL